MQSNSNKIPSLPHTLYKDRQLNISYISSTVPPFYSSTDALVTEKGMSDPYFIRSTMYSLPQSEYALECSHLPIGVILNPFNDKGVLNEIMTSTNGPNSSFRPEKCLACRSYVNSFTLFENGKYICNICNSELKLINMNNSASFEFLTDGLNKLEDNSLIATTEHMPKDGISDSGMLFRESSPSIQPPCAVFVLDLSSSILVRSSLQVIKNICLSEEFQFLHKSITFVLLNGGITVFRSLDGIDITVVKYPGCDMKNSNSKSGKMIEDSSSKLNKASLPRFAANSILSTKNIANVIDKIMEYIDRLPYNGPTSTNSMLSVVSQINKLCIASKVVILSDEPNDINFEEFLESNQNCCINMIHTANVGSSEKISNNNLVRLAFYSSGSIHKITPDSNKEFSIQTILSLIYSTKSVYDINIFLKLSDNLIKLNTVASTLNDGLTKMHLNHMNSNSTVLYSLGLSGISQKNKYLQAEITYTDYDGVRKTRILNLKYGISTNLFISASSDTLFAYLVKSKINSKIDINEELAQIMAYYRRKHSNNGESNSKSSATFNQLILPDSLKTLPVLVQAVDKIANPDLFFLVNASVEQTMKYFYPSLISLSDYYSDNNCMAIRLSLNNILENEIYVLENSREIIIYLSRNMEKDLYSSLIDIETTSENHIDLIRSGTEVGSLVLKLIDQIILHYSYPLSVSIIKAGDPNEATFLGYMVEDAINGQQTYMDYIYKLHEKIRQY